TQQIRQPECHQKRVEVLPCAEEPGEHLLANQPKNAAAQNCDADDSRRARACLLIVRRSHRRTKNNVSGFTKAKSQGSLGRDIAPLAVSYKSQRTSKLLDFIAACL